MRIVPLVMVLALPATTAAAELPPGFHRSPWFQEAVREAWLEDSVHALMNLAAALDPAKPTQLFLHATPNGGTVEQTLG